MNNPVLSICIPTYNRSGYLKKCLDSIVCQFDNDEIINNVEIVISDNASEDNTQELVEDYRKKYSNIKYFRNKENLGFDLNVFNVVHSASGFYCWYLGDDDMVINGGLRFVLEELQKKQCDILTVESTPETKKNYCNKNTNFIDSCKIYVKDGNSFYFNNFCQGGFSVLIFNREKWIENVDLSNYLKHWLYYEVVLKILISSKKTNTYITTPVITTGQDCRWSENGTEIFTYINSNFLMEKMISFGFDKKRLKNSMQNNKKKVIIILLRAKGHGLKCNLENLKIIYQYIKILNCFTFFVVITIYFIPNRLIVAIRDFRKFILNLK